MTDAPTVTIPAVTEQPPAWELQLREHLHALEVTAARLAQDRYAALLLAAVYDQARLREATGRHRAERDLDVLLRSCFARQSALTDPSVREQRLTAQLTADREYAAKLEAFLDQDAEERRVLVDRQTALLAENADLKRRLAVAGTDVARPKGRRRRTR